LDEVVGLGLESGARTVELRLAVDILATGSGGQPSDEPSHGSTRNPALDRRHEPAGEGTGDPQRLFLR
jgi:hypothetical protein